MSTRRRLLLALAGLCGVAAWPGARAGELPPAPAGFTWFTSTNGAGTFLRPDGLFAKEETHGDTRAVFITKTSIADGGDFDVGFTVNAFDHVSRGGATARAAATALIARLAKRGRVLLADVVKGNALDMNVVRIVDTARGAPVVIHYLTIGDDARDRMWLIFFEAPQSEWDAHYPLGRAMLNGFGL
jgi:hypothetical protein